MSDQTPAGAIARQGHTELDLELSARDRAILGDLASRVAELAARPVEDAKRDLWYRHNALEATRPVIFCDPENGWNEIIRPADLACEGELARSWEMRLRKEIWWGEVMRDDRVIEPVFDVAHVYTESDWGMQETRIGGQDGGSYTWDAPLKDYADLDRLRFPRITVDAAATERSLALAEEAVGHALTVRLKTVWWWTLGMTWTLINLRGLTQVMLDMSDHPDELHRLMAFLRDGHLARLDYLESEGLLSLNNDGTYVGSGGFGWTHELPQADHQGRVRTMDMWGFAESQETVHVSPRMFAEFVFPYQEPLLARFGLNCYGCCEPLDKRWHIVERFPRLRRISVSAWADPAAMAELLGDRYIYSYKPTPADLAMPSFDAERIRAGLREVMRITRDCRLEVIMKDNHTIGNDPSRVVNWVRIAREEAERLT
ncbi:MAG TPA: hypothetical protein GX714_04515 [Chloroflexi bacterium]|jgi:hypothetical protein|nr:hypothetical protein [Chloroflexota bacterium]